MPIKIGERSLATTPPADLDDKLVASTGCKAAEHVAMLNNRLTPVGVAAALAPFLTGEDAPSRADLAGMLGALPPEDLIAVRGEVVALLKSPVAVFVPAAPSAAPVPGQPA